MKHRVFFVGPTLVFAALLSVIAPCALSAQDHLSSSQNECLGLSSGIRSRLDSAGDLRWFSQLHNPLFDLRLLVSSRSAQTPVAYPAVEGGIIGSIRNDGIYQGNHDDPILRVRAGMLALDYGANLLRRPLSGNMAAVEAPGDFLRLPLWSDELVHPGCQISAGNLERGLEVSLAAMVPGSPLPGGEPEEESHGIVSPVAFASIVFASVEQGLTLGLGTLFLGFDPVLVKPRYPVADPELAKPALAEPEFEEPEFEEPEFEEPELDDPEAEVHSSFGETAVSGALLQSALVLRVGSEGQSGPQVFARDEFYLALGLSRRAYLFDGGPQWYADRPEDFPWSIRAGYRLSLQLPRARGPLLPSGIQLSAHYRRIMSEYASWTAAEGMLETLPPEGDCTVHAMITGAGEASLGGSCDWELGDGRSPAFSSNIQADLPLGAWLVQCEVQSVEELLRQPAAPRFYLLTQLRFSPPPLRASLGVRIRKTPAPWLSDVSLMFSGRCHPLSFGLGMKTHADAAGSMGSGFLPSIYETELRASATISLVLANGIKITFALRSPDGVNLDSLMYGTTRHLISDPVMLIIEVESGDI